MIVNFDYPLLNCKSISVIELYIFIISIMDVCIYPRYIYGYRTNMQLA